MLFVGGFRLDHEDLITVCAGIRGCSIDDVLEEERELVLCIGSWGDVKSKARRTKSALSLLSVLSSPEESAALAAACPHYLAYRNVDGDSDEEFPFVPEAVPPVDCILITRIDKRKKGDEREVKFSEKVDGKALDFLAANGLDMSAARGKWVSLPEWRVPSLKDEFLLPVERS